MEHYKCTNCGFKAGFTNPWTITKLDFDNDTYYIECPFCEEQMHEETE